MVKRQVRVIPAVSNTYIEGSTVLKAQKKKLAAYCRVSTDSEEQQNSYSAQLEYYTDYINSKPEWELYKIYADEGISGTSTKNRDGFNNMIADALSGKIDLIVTKSVSRFARNTVDSLTTVRQLKEKGVEIFFEKENIYTFDSKGELLITIMSSLAQEESRSLSENTTWGQRKRFADGKVSLPYGRFLGYEKGDDGMPKIVEKEAKIVRLIYKMFLDGKTPLGIARYLTSENIPTPAGMKDWHGSTVDSILQNEKYKGDALLQKSFTVDFLTKKTKINEGEIPQYYVENSHSAIIDPNIFDLVQQEFQRRKSLGRVYSNNNVLSSKIICGQCGSFYGSKLWHSTSKYRRTVWQCNHKFDNKEKCSTPHIYEEKLKQAFVDVFNSIIENKAEIIENYKAIVETITDTTAIDKKILQFQNECDVVFELLRKCVEENSHCAIDQEEYKKKYSALTERFETAKNGITEISEKRLHMATKREQIDQFLKILSESDLLTEFDEGIWFATVESVKVYPNNKLVFIFKDGKELDWGI